MPRLTKRKITMYLHHLIIIKFPLWSCHSKLRTKVSKSKEYTLSFDSSLLYCWPICFRKTGRNWVWTRGRSVGWRGRRENSPSIKREVRLWSPSRWPHMGEDQKITVKVWWESENRFFVVCSFLEETRDTVSLRGEKRGVYEKETVVGNWSCQCTCKVGH